MYNGEVMITTDTVIDNNIDVILPFERHKEVFIESLGEVPKKPFYAFVKRAIDIVVSLFAMVIMFIPVAISGIIIKCTSKGSIFYSQERLGLNGEKFNLIKLRTMREDAEKNGVMWSQGDSDPRITKFGLFLRKTHIDEVPQFLLILSGKMSLVGPRPEREVFYNEFEQYIHGFHERLKVKPGLTGLAQVNGAYNLRPEEKIVFDVEYIKNRSIINEIKIMLKTVGVVLRGDGAK